MAVYRQGFSLSEQKTQDCLGLSKLLNEIHNKKNNVDKIKNCKNEELHND